jgi:hypothetical protein
VRNLMGMLQTLQMPVQMIQTMMRITTVYAVMKRLWVVKTQRHATTRVLQPMPGIVLSQAIYVPRALVKPMALARLSIMMPMSVVSVLVREQVRGMQILIMMGWALHSIA